MAVLLVLGLLHLLLALQPVCLSSAATQQVAILTGQQFADEVVKWGRTGGNVTLVITAPLISLRNATWPNVTNYPPPSSDPGSPFSSGHLTITSATPQNRSIIDAANRAGLIPYSTGTAGFTLESVIFINLCQVQLQIPSTQPGTHQPVISTYTSCLYLALLMGRMPAQANPVRQTLAYTVQTDLSGTVYDLLMVHTAIPPLRDATEFRTRILSADQTMVYFLQPYSAILEPELHSSQSSNAIVSLKSPADTLLQQLRAQNLFLPAQYCNGTALPHMLAEGDVDPAEGALWFADESVSFIKGLTAAAQLTVTQASTQGLPPAVMLLGNASLAAVGSNSSSNLPWHVWYPLLLTGPLSSAQQSQVDATLDLANLTGVFVLHSPVGQLAIQGLILKGLSLPSSSMTTSQPSAFPFSFVSIANSSSAVNTSQNIDSDSTITYTPVWLSNVTLIMTQRDFLALAALALAVKPSGGFEDVSSCLDPTTARVAAYLAPGVITIQAAQQPDDTPSEVLLAVFQGWGINGTSIRLVPEAPLNLSMSLAACTTATDSGDSAASDSGSGLSTPQIVGLAIGLTVGVLLLAACTLLLAVCARSKSHTALKCMQFKGPHVSRLSEPSNASFGITAVTDDAAVQVLASALQQNVQRKTAAHAALLEGASSGTHNACSTLVLPDSGSTSGLRAARGEGPTGPEAAGIQITIHSSEERSTAQTGLSGDAFTEELAARLAGGGSSGSSTTEKPISNTVAAAGHSSGKMLQPLQEVQQLAAALSSSNGADKVSVKGMLGQGASGSVYYGTWRSLPVALKTVLLPAEQALQRAVMEAAIAASVGHPNVVATYHYDFKPIVTQHDEEGTSTLQVSLGLADSHPGDMAVEGPCGFKLFLVQELCAASLSEALDDGLLHDPVTHAVNQDDVLSIIKGIACGLAYLHSKGIVHADLKPCNVLLKAVDTTTAEVIPKLADFGLSVHLPHDRSHVSGFTSGTPFYVAPEVVLKKQASTASDIYSLGIVMWQLYSGEQPYMYDSDDGPAVWNPAVGQFMPPNVPPQAFQQLVISCLQVNPSLRPTATLVLNIVTAIQSALQAVQSQAIQQRSRSLLGNAF